MLSVDVLVEQTGESKNQIFRLVRLTELIVTLLDKVDSKKLAFNPAVELSYLSQKEQLAVSEAMEKYEVKPSLSQAVLLKKMKQAGTLSLDDIDEVLAVSKKTQDKKQTDEADRFREFFPTDYTANQINKVIADLLREWQARQTG
jgi:ParB family chromosome partitioning protein